MGVGSLYRVPGFPLFRTITPGADVYVLQNHGLVVAADTFEAAVALLAEVGRRLARPVQTVSGASRLGVERPGYHFIDAPALTPHAVRSSLPAEATIPTIWCSSAAGRR